MIYTIINDVSTATIPKCILTAVNQSELLKPRYETTVVPSVHGDFKRLSAYDNTTWTLNFHVKTLNDVYRLTELFHGIKNKIQFTNTPKFFHYFDFVKSSVDMKTTTSYAVQIEISVYPFRYMKNIPLIVLQSSGTIENIGTVYSEPIVVVEGSGDCRLTIGKQVMSLRIDTKCTIDCTQKQQAIYDKNNQLKNSIRLSGSFFEIQKGTQGVILSQGIRKVTITPNWRYLA